MLLRVLVGTVLLAGCLALNYDGHQVVRVKPSTLEHYKELMQARETHAELDFWSEPRFGEHIDIRVAPEHADLLHNIMKRSNMDSEVVANNLQDMMDAEATSNAEAKSSKVGIVGTYATPEDIATFLTEKCAESPIATCRDLGTSYEGRPLRMIRINSGGSNTKPAIFFDCGIHAREWISPATCVWIIEKVLQDYNTDAEWKALVDTYDWYIVPSANPDGYAYTQASNGERLWRKTRSVNTGNACVGVDPNRNYDMHWGGSGTSSNSCSDIYKGPRAFSEKETKALSDFQNTLTGRYAVYVAVHSYAQMWLTPWGYTALTLPPTYNELKRVADIGTAAIVAVNKGTWRAGSAAKLLGAGAGGSDDWAYDNAKATYSYTLEIRPQSGTFNGFVVAASHIEPSGREVYAGLKAAFRAVKDKMNY